MSTSAKKCGLHPTAKMRVKSYSVKGTPYLVCTVCSKLPDPKSDLTPEQKRNQHNILCSLAHEPRERVLTYESPLSETYSDYIQIFTGGRYA